MLSGLLKRYGGNVHEALSAYNAGSPTATGTKTRWSDGSDLAYADSVMRHYASSPAGPRRKPIRASRRLASRPSQVGALRSRAQRFPRAMPAHADFRAAPSRVDRTLTVPSRKPTDYVQLFNDDTDETTRRTGEINVSSLPSILEGSISAKTARTAHRQRRYRKSAAAERGSVRGALETGSFSATPAIRRRTPPIAELERAHLVPRLALVAGAELAAQPADAAGLAAKAGYRPQSTDYTQFGDDSN